MIFYFIVLYLYRKYNIDRIERVRNFKYLGERIQENGLEKSDIEERITNLDRMERAYGITKDMYNKMWISIKMRK